MYVSFVQEGIIMDAKEQQKKRRIHPRPGSLCRIAAESNVGVMAHAGSLRINEKDSTVLTGGA
jgi:hypothetical protein